MRKNQISGHSTQHGPKVHKVCHTVGHDSRNKRPRCAVVYEARGDNEEQRVWDSIGCEIPAAATIINCSITVTEVFNGLASIKVGNTANDALIYPLTPAILGSLGTHSLPQSTPWGILSVVRTTIGGNPTQGVAKISVSYTLA
jgi:hypothetical protein